MLRSAMIRAASSRGTSSVTVSGFALMTLSTASFARSEAIS